MPIVREDLDLPGQQAPLAQVTIELAGENCEPIGGNSSVPSPWTTIFGAKVLKQGHGIGPGGYWELDLVGNENITPSGTVYRITRKPSAGMAFIQCISVPATGGPYNVSDLVVDPPGSIASAALEIHSEAPIDDGNHGVVEHDWATDGWTEVDDIIISDDPGQVFAKTVVGGRGIITGTQSGAGSLRVCHARRNTNWSDGVITSLVYGPTADWDGSNAQQGHLHRVRKISDTMWEAIAIWTSVVLGGDYAFLHTAGVRFDGTALLTSGGAPGFGAADINFIDGRVPVTEHARVFFGSWINTYKTPRTELMSRYAVGDLVFVDDDDASFDLAGNAILGVDVVQGSINVGSPTATGAVPLTLTSGFLQHDTSPAPQPDSQKRYTPFKFATRVVGGSTAAVTIEAKRWRIHEIEPDWGDSRVQRGAVTANASVPELALGPGLHAWWNAHYHDGSGGAWGRTRFEKVT